MTSNATGTFKKHRVEWLRLSDIVAHPKIQRRFRPSRAEQLAKAFDPELFRELYVVSSGTKYLAFDGQHRLHAAIKVLGPDQLVPCRVFEDLPIERQAALFLGLNDAVKVSSLDRWRQRLNAKDEVACKIEATLKHYDLKTPGTGAYRSESVIPSVVSLERIWTQQGGDQVLSRSLSIIKKAWPKDNFAFHSIVLEGVASVVSAYNGQIKDSDLAERLSLRTTPARLIGLARQWAESDSTSVRKAAPIVIIRLYNKRLIKKAQ